MHHLRDDVHQSEEEETDNYTGDRALRRPSEATPRYPKPRLQATLLTCSTVFMTNAPPPYGKGMESLINSSATLFWQYSTFRSCANIMYSRPSLQRSTFSRDVPKERGWLWEVGPVGVGIGIDTGPASIGAMSWLTKDFTIIGSVVNTASRIQGAANAGEVLVSKEVYERVAEPFSQLRISSVSAQRHRTTSNALSPRVTE